MKKTLSLLCVLITTCCTAWAAPRSQEKATQIARAFLTEKAASIPALRAVRELQLAGTSQTLLKKDIHTDKPTQPAFYVYNQGTQAFVIVSGDDRMPAVLAYSSESEFVTENMPENLRSWLGYYADMYDIVARDETTKEYKKIKTADGTSFPDNVQPLLKDIQYNQDAPYNLLCPVYNDQYCVTGCVATATAQIMRYWGYPDAGTGSVSYTTSSLKIPCTYDFEANPFDWDLIRNAYTGNESNEEKNAVANLMQACGVASRMDYTPWASGTASDNMFIGLIENLGYAPDYMASKYNYSSDEWMNLIKTELTARRPIYYSGNSTQGGHAFVIDGYDAQDMVHVNWGWGGYCNGYFDVLTLNSNGAGIGGHNDGSYQFYQTIIVGLQPQDTKTEQRTTQFCIEAVESSKTQVSKNETFDVTFTNFYNQGYTVNDGYVGLILEKDGVQTVLGSYTFSAQHGWGWSSFYFSNVRIPSSAVNGIYELYVGTRISDQQRWAKARGPETTNTSYQVIVENNRCTFVSDVYDINDLEISMTPTHNIYQGFEAGIRVDVTNRGDNSFFGEIDLLVYDEDDNQADFWYGRYILLAPGESTTFNISSAVQTKPGNYTCLPAIHTQHSLYCPDTAEAQSLTILEPEEGTPTLKVTGVSLKEKTISSGTPLTIRASLSISGKGSVNQTMLVHRYVRRSDGQEVANVWELPFVEKGKTLAYSYDFLIDAEPGNYIYDLYKYVNNTFTKAYTTAFTVTEPATGIRDTAEATGQPSVYSHCSDGNVVILCPEELLSVTVYDLTGRQVKKMTPEKADNTGRYTIPTGHLPRGNYLMRLTCVDNKVYGIRFIR